MNKYYMICILLLLGCSTLKENMVIKGNKDDAVKNAISDFIHTENTLLKDDRTFFIHTENIGDYIEVSIMGDPNTILLISEKKGSYSYRAFPTMLVENNGKLFFWYDETKSVTDTIIKTLYQYNFVDTLIVNAYIPDRIINDAKKGVIYYFCKNDLTKYKKVITNKITENYKLPKLKCK